MKMFANHYADTPHGLSHPTISVSVLLTALFVGAQWVVYVLAVVTIGADMPTIYDSGSPFAMSSLIVALLLLAFLAVDFRRNRLEAHGAQRFQYVIFGVAAALLAAFMLFLVRAMQFGSLG